MVRVFLALVLVAASAPALPGPPIQGNTCTEGAQASGAIYRICMPEEGLWNGDLVVFAHGYVDPNLPVGIPEDQLVLPDGTSLPDLINNLGYAFATTSYSINGLAVLQGTADILDLVEIFSQEHPEVEHIFLTGASEGGIITTLAVEQNPEVFSGGLATCGPIGSFRKQIDYWGDFRVVFDYFFPGVLPPSPIDIPQQVMDGWETVYEPAISAAIAANPNATSQLLRVTRAPIDAGDPETIQETVLGLLWYNAFATNDGIDKLGGQPFDNLRRIYSGSNNDFELNKLVQHFSADPAALAEIEAFYQTSGMLQVPLVTMHTSGDPIIPYWHVPLYRLKVIANHSDYYYSNLPVLRYGHCNFTTGEVLVGFALLVFRSTGSPIDRELALQALPDITSQTEFLQMAEQYGALP